MPKHASSVSEGYVFRSDGGVAGEEPPDTAGDEGVAESDGGLD